MRVKCFVWYARTSQKTRRHVGPLVSRAWRVYFWETVEYSTIQRNVGSKTFLTEFIFSALSFGNCTNNVQRKSTVRMESGVGNLVHKADLG